MIAGCATRDAGGGGEPVASPPLGPLVRAVVDAGAPGALVLVRDGRREWRAAAGRAELYPPRPLRPGDRFRVASITKAFTATLVLQLAAERALRLEDPVERWLPGLLPDGERITVRELLLHRSGLYDHLDLPEVDDVDRRWRPRELVALSAPRPRARGFAYSSTNYVILGLIVERVTGRPYRQLLHERIVAPLRLRATAYEPGADPRGGRVHGHVTTGHDGFVARATPASVRDDHSAAAGGAAGALVSSAGDVATFLDALLGGRLVAPRVVAAMVPPRRRGERSYGLGLVAHPLPCGHAIGHTGNLLGTVTVAYRAGGRTVVAMTNQHPLAPPADAAFRRLVERAACGRVR